MRKKTSSLAVDVEMLRAQYPRINVVKLDTLSQGEEASAVKNLERVIRTIGAKKLEGFEFLLGERTALYAHGGVELSSGMTTNAMHAFLVKNLKDAKRLQAKDREAARQLELLGKRYPYIEFSRSGIFGEEMLANIPKIEKILAKRPMAALKGKRIHLTNETRVTEEGIRCVDLTKSEAEIERSI